MLLALPVKVPVEMFIVGRTEFVTGEAFGFELGGLCSLGFRPNTTVRQFALGLR